MTNANGATTVVKNRLLHPDGTPMRGVEVLLVVRANNTWVADSTGRVLGEVRTWTNAAGCWRTPLLPWSAYHDRDFVYVEVIEGGRTSGYLRVPPMPVGTEIWIGEHLVNPPPTAAPGAWRPVAELRDLADVDRDVITDAPDGAVLVKRGGRWVAELPDLGKDRLAELADVDQSTLSWANDGDPLSWLADRAAWGVKYSPQDITLVVAHDETNPMGVTAYASGDASLTISLLWETGGEPVEIAHDELISHVYAEPGLKTISAYYDGYPDSLVQQEITVPSPEQEETPR